MIVASRKEVKLKVAEATQDDVNRGVVRLDSAIIKDLGIHQGSVVELEGARKTVAIVERAFPSDIGLAIVRMDGLVRRNAGATISEYVTIRPCQVKAAKSIAIAPVQKGVIFQAHPSIFKHALLERPVRKGDIISLGGNRRRRAVNPGNFEDNILRMAFGDDQYNLAFGFADIKFLVINTNPKDGVVIVEDTEIDLEPEAVELKEEKVPDVTYEDIGGLKEEITKVREMIELPMKHPEIFETLGIQPPKGVLLYGPPGTGKTLLARAVATESNANFISINGPEIMSKFVGDAEKRLRDIFNEAEKNAPSIIFIDEIDAIAPKREESYGEVERRVVAQLLSLMDGLKSRGKVIVIAATNRQDSLDPALRRGGRFDREIEIGVPDKNGRLIILKIHTRHMPLEKNVDLKELAKVDLNAEEQIPSEILEKLKVVKQDFKEALKMVRPSAMREVLIESPKVNWTDIGGLVKAKQELIEAVEWPLKYPEKFKKLGIRPPRGILLYGPS